MLLLIIAGVWLAVSALFVVGLALAARKTVPSATPSEIEAGYGENVSIEHREQLTDVLG